MVSSSLTPGTVATVEKSVVSCELEDGAALLDMRSGTYFGLNDVALHIWNTIQQPCRVDAIAHSVVTAYNIDASTAMEDAKRILARLADAGLIHLTPDETA